jgi:RND family efflux transporter MFP subunit
MNLRIPRSLTALLLLVLTGCGLQPAKTRPEVDRLPRVETVTPQYLAREDTVELLATVEAMERARLCAQVQGEVRDLSASIDIGRPITKDEPLITLDIPAIRAEQASKQALLVQAKNLLDQAGEAKKVAAKDVEEAKAQVARWRADLDFRELALKRVRTLTDSGAVQAQMRDESQLQRNSARAAWEAARATVQSKEARLQAAEVEVRVASSRVSVAQADVKLLDTRVEFATIRAPFDGIITRRWVDNGAIIRDPTMPLLTVMRTDQMRVVMDVPERYVPYIRAAQGLSPAGRPNRVRLRIHNYHGDEPITRLAAAVHPVTRLMRAEVHVKNDRDFRLRPGMTGTATVVLSEGQTRRLTVPATSLVRVGDEVRVYYLDQLTTDDPPQGKVKSAVVTLGLDDGKTVEVCSGLSGKELVIAKGNGVVREGEQAIAVKARAQKYE